MGELLLSLGIAIIYGGGQIPEANILLATLIRKIMEIPNIALYGIRKSFMGMADENEYEVILPKKLKELKRQIGTYLETCRKFSPYADENFPKVIENLKKHNIHTLFVTGGDGSAVCIKKFIKKCNEVGYPIRIIWIPCTIDGINGTETIGILAAVKETIRRIISMAVNAFATWDNGKLGPRVAIIEVPGRNRNDIAVRALRAIKKMGYIGQYKLSDIKIIFLASGEKWSYIDLLKEVNTSTKPVLIVACEGACPIEKHWSAIEGTNVSQKIGNLINADGTRKANVDIIAYLCQTNEYITPKDKELINSFVEKAVEVAIKSNDDNCIADAKAIICDNDVFKEVPIEYITDQNTSDKPIPLSEEERKEFKKFIM